MSQNARFPATRLGLRLPKLAGDFSRLLSQTHSEFGPLMAQTVRKAVFPVAGLGTRFLPATKSIPKEMLPVLDRPLIQYAVEEAKAAGIEHFIFVTGRGKGAMEDHFDRAPELERTLEAAGKTLELKALADLLPEAGSISYTRQQAPLGLGHAVWCARDIIGNEPFAVMLPDMITLPGQRKSRCLAQCIEAYEKHGGNIIAVEEVPPQDTHMYGIVSVGQDHGHTFQINGMVEKPPQGTSPSNLIISGRYILEPQIFDILGKVEKGAGGEIQLTDGMKELAKSQGFHGVRFDGKTYDTGSKVGFLAANVAFAMSRDDIRPGFLTELQKIVGSL